MIPHAGRRGAAFAVDALLALMISGILLTPLVALSDPAVWRVINPVPLLWALCFIFTALLTRGATPGKRWLKLHLAGTGCLICREIRRMGWALMLGLAALLPDSAPATAAPILNGIGLGLLLWALAHPFVTKARDWPHNTATDFTVTGP